MKKYRSLLIVLLLMFIFIPVCVKAETFKSSDGTTYLLEKQTLQCDLINISDKDNVQYLGKDDNSNYIYHTINSNDYYKVDNNGCSKMAVGETLKYLNTIKSTWYEIDGVNINKITQGVFDVSHIEVTNGIVEQDKSYCQLDLVTNSYPCGVTIDTTRPFYEAVYIKHIDSLEVKEDNTVRYYTISDQVDSLSTLVEVPANEIKRNISEDTGNPENAFNYYVILDDYEESEIVKTVTNEKLLNLINEGNYPESVTYDKNNDLFYINFLSPLTEEIVVYDSNGNKINTQYILHTKFSNSLFFGYSPTSNGGVILDKDGNALYQDENFWMLQERDYNNYILELDNVDNDEIVTHYKLYEHKLLSEDNRVTNGKSDFIIKFSGPLEKIKLGSIKINDELLDEENYTLASGSTIITLTKEYLSNLSDGKYTLTLEYLNDIVLSTDFNIDTNNTDEKTVTVTFDANGGKFENSDTYTINNWTYNLYDSLVKPTKEGYIFKGYYTEKTGGTKLELILNESGIVSDTTFYAQWEKEEEVPKTFDGIMNSIIIGTVSLIGLVGITIYLKKKNKVRA